MTYYIVRKLSKGFSKDQEEKYELGAVEEFAAPSDDAARKHFFASMPLITADLAKYFNRFAELVRYEKCLGGYRNMALEGAPGEIIAKLPYWYKGYGIYNGRDQSRLVDLTRPELENIDLETIAYFVTDIKPPR